MSASESHWTGQAQRIEGLSDKTNTVLFAFPRHCRPSLAVVAFPGDGVESPSWPPALPGAAGHHPHSGGLLAALFARLVLHGDPYVSAALFVIEPDYIHKGYAIFKHFLGSTTASGEPMSGFRTFGTPAASQLLALFDALALSNPEELGTLRHEEIWGQVPVAIFGFSKGGVVVTQFLSEVADAPSCSGRVGDLLARITEVHYLDAGLPCRGAHLTSPTAAAKLGKLPRPPRVCIHGTPRQWQDPERRWLVAEKDRSVALLRAADVPVFSREYFQDQPSSIKQHFDVVERFDLGLGE